MSKTPSPMLLALTAAAASLPGMSAPAQAAEPNAELGYRYSHYSESALPASATNSRDGSRYEVQTHQFRALHAVNPDLDLTADVMVESMSGASPWFIAPDANGRPVQILSGASIEEKRTALEVRARQRLSGERRTLKMGLSSENDYTAVSAGVEGEWDFDQARRTLSAGMGYSYDIIQPTDGGSARFPNRIVEADKDSYNTYIGLSQLLSPQTVVQAGFSYAYSDGFLSDPYKQAFVADNIVPDTRPQSRNEFALSARLRHYFAGVNAALHLDGRTFRDDWGIGSDTVEAAWVQKLPGDWRLTPSLRWYQQGQADFYRPYFTRTRSDGHYSSDYRLSAYGAISTRLAVEKVWRGWAFSAAVERYDSDAGYTTRKVSDENPGLVDFVVISAAINYRFSFGGGAAVISERSASMPSLPAAPAVQVIPVVP